MSCAASYNSVWPDPNCVHPPNGAQPLRLGARFAFLVHRYRADWVLLGFLPRWGRDSLFWQSRNKTRKAGACRFNE